MHSVCFSVTFTNFFKYFQIDKHYSPHILLKEYIMLQKNIKWVIFLTKTEFSSDESDEGVSDKE